MRRWLRRTIPSMFHRRLLLLGVIVAALLAGLGLQTTRLTTGQRHQSLRDKAERSLQRVAYIPTVRGRILDRTGAVLAVDEPSWNVQVHYSLLTQEWVLNQAETAARLTLGWDTWKQMSRFEKDKAIASYLPAYQEQAEQMWQLLADLGGQSREELEELRRSIVRRTEIVAEEVTQRNRQNRIAKSQEDVSTVEAHMRIREQTQPHAVLFDVDESAVAMLSSLMAEAQASAPSWRRQRTRGVEFLAPPPGNAVWLDVAPVRARHRRYPLETLTLTLDRASFPGPLRSDTPIEITVPGVGLHMLGQMRPANTEDAAWERRPFLKIDEDTGERAVNLAGYRKGDRIGAFGIERSLEKKLRGSRGRETQRLDTGEDVSRTPPMPGEDVVLTLDHRLQARIQALMSHDERVGLMRVQPWLETPHLPVGAPLHGSAVVLDIVTGEVLAAVSIPGITLDQLTHNRDAIFKNFTDEPFTFRPTAYPREPGSAIKPLLLAAAITEGVLGVHETIDCTRGYLYKDRPNTFQDWIYRQYEGQTFGVIDGVTAIKVSANTFFGELGKRLKPHRVHGWLEALGAGRKLDLAIEERTGTLFDPAAADAAGQANLASIGQGKLTMTPLQVIAAHATLSRGGLYIAPTFVRGTQRKTVDLDIPATAIDAIQRGMWKSANEGREDDAVSGTTFSLNMGEALGREPYFNAPGVIVYAKSGSAQTSPTVEKFDDDGDGRVDRFGDIVRAGAHGWVVALVKPDGQPQPTIGIVVCVEHGWSGGKSAGPLANQIIRACQAEGYLPSPPAADGAFP